VPTAAPAAPAPLAPVKLDPAAPVPPAAQPVLFRTVPPSLDPKGTRAHMVTGVWADSVVTSHCVDTKQDSWGSGNSWIKEWRKQTGQSNPVCATKGCHNESELCGGHVWLQPPAGAAAAAASVVTHCYIVPLCANHNANPKFHYPSKLELKPGTWHVRLEPWEGSVVRNGVGQPSPRAREDREKALAVVAAA
jgi:hypothetical protein